MKHKNLESIRSFVRNFTGVAATLVVGMVYAAPVAFSKLQALKGLQDG